jgi:hypothetical protein
MAQWAVAQRSATINLACRAFAISRTCYRYMAKLDKENSVIADWLVRLTNNQRNWGIGLCFLYPRNVKDFKWNTKGAHIMEGTPGVAIRSRPVVIQSLYSSHCLVSFAVKSSILVGAHFVARKPFSAPNSLITQRLNAF